MSRIFEFKISKDEVIQLTNLLYSLALISDLEEVQLANFIWSNISSRNMYGYSLNFDKFYKHLCRERKLKNSLYEKNK